MAVIEGVYFLFLYLKYIYFLVCADQFSQSSLVAVIENFMDGLYFVQLKSGRNKKEREK